MFDWGLGKLSQEAQDIGAILDAAIGSVPEDRAAASTALSGLSGAEIASALANLVTRHGAAAIDLLEYLALNSAEAPAEAAATALGTIRDTASASALERAASSVAQPQVRKALRRSLHRLVSVGVAPTPADGPRAESTPSGPAEVYRVVASPVDGAGNRALWFAFKRAGGVDFVSLLLNDEEGIRDIFVREASTSRFDRESRQVMNDRDFPWIEMPADYARHLVDVTQRKNAASGTSLPVEYLARRSDLARPEASYDQALVYSVINAAEVRWEPRYLDNSAALFELELFQGWILEKDELSGFVQEKLSVERSGIVLPGMAGEARERRIEEKAVEAVFDAARRALYKGRLEEMAYLLWKLGRPEAARQALAAALALEPADRPLSRHPFVVTMVERSIELAAEMTRGERTRAVRPGVQLHLPY